MTAKKSFLIVLRIFFILFSLQFIKDAFYKWDGYSYYMRFIDFLPDLSLAFILWTIFGVIFALAFWVIMYGLPKILPKPLKVIRFEHIIVFFILVVFPVFIKRTFFSHISIGGLVGLSHLTTLIIAGVLVAVAIWFGRRYVEKILYGFDSRITPLVWFFVLLLILAVPFSMFTPLEKIFLTGFTKESPDAHYISNNAAYSTFKKMGDEPYSDSSLGIESRYESIPTQRRTDRPNIILVTMDALTARNMQVYGYHRPTTPFISEWAKDAMVFNKAYSTSNWTTPAAMSIMTGQRPWTHRVWHLVYNNPVSNNEDNLPKILKNYGYTVYGFIQNMSAHPEILGIKGAFLVKDRAHTFWIPTTWLVDKSVKFYVNRPIVAEWIFLENPLIKPLNIKIFRDPIYITSILPETVYNRFLEHISQNPKQPFFTWIHIYPPHILYLPPKPYMGMFGDSEKLNTAEKQLNSNLIDIYYKPDRQKDVDILRKRYDEFVLYSDQQFKLLLSRLAETIDMSNTTIILSSDHGESFSHGYCGHGHFELYEPLVHIPLVIKMPVGIDSQNRVSVRVDSDASTYRGKTDGRIIDIPVEQIDIAPTILELAGIPVPEWMEGQSLLPLLKDKSLEPRPVFSMQLIENRVIGNYPITRGTIAVWDRDYKLIHYLSETRSEEDKKSLLFNLRSDPDETKNIFNEKPEISQRLMKLIYDNLSNANARITQYAKK